ncbi:MAG TPA: hypothetical protein VG713_14620 [Pirellulales bacterium]|nr:hypothetical protein [Pirellulales bacterium]
MRHLVSFESKHDPLVPRHIFAKRLARNFAAALLLIGVSLAAGMIGYHRFENMSWIDAFANAAMILSGMGPLGELKSSGGKLFAGCYALYSGLVVIVATGIIFAPAIHRMLHSFHAAQDKS